MAGYKEPGFEQRVNAAAEARNKALEKLKSRPQVDEAELARRIAAQAAKEAAAAEKREAAKLEREAAQAAKLERALAEKEAAEAAALKAAPKIKTEAELKAARDERYAARKSRKK
jgi:hypothetical protein